MMHATRRDALEWFISILSLYLFFWSLLFFIRTQDIDPLVGSAALSLEIIAAIYFFPRRKRSKWEF